MISLTVISPCPHRHTTSQCRLNTLPDFVLSPCAKREMGCGGSKAPAAPSAPSARGRRYSTSTGAEFVKINELDVTKKEDAEKLKKLLEKEVEEVRRHRRVRARSGSNPNALRHCRAGQPGHGRNHEAFDGCGCGRRGEPR